MIGFKSHSGDAQSSRPRKAHDNPVYHSRSLTRGDPKEIYRCDRKVSWTDGIGTLGKQSHARVQT